MYIGGPNRFVIQLLTSRLARPQKENVVFLQCTQTSPFVDQWAFSCVRTAFRRWLLYLTYLWTIFTTILVLICCHLFSTTLYERLQYYLTDLFTCSNSVRLIWTLQYWGRRACDWLSPNLMWLWITVGAHCFWPIVQSPWCRRAWNGGNISEIPEYCRTVAPFTGSLTLWNWHVTWNPGGSSSFHGNRLAWHAGMATLLCDWTLAISIKLSLHVPPEVYSSFVHLINRDYFAKTQWVMTHH